MSEARKPSLTESLKKLEAIAAWFDEQEEIDVEKALVKMKEGVALLKESKARLKDIENEFVVVKKDLEDDSKGM